MIKIQLGADGLARSRFALSPLSETVRLLLAASAGTVPRPLRAPLRETVAAHRLDLLAALLSIQPGAGHYVPDFLTPAPPRFETSAAEELHAVATTPAWRVAGELAVTADGRIAKIVGRALSPRLRRALDAGEARVADRLAGELEQVWTSVLAPQWPRLRARMEADIAQRLRTVAEHGFAATIDGLDPAVDWRDGALCFHAGFEAEVREQAVLFLPSVFTSRASCAVDPVVPFDAGCAGVDLTRRRTAMLAYPVARQGPGTPPEPPRRGELIGRTRARILAAVASPATTGEVAGRLRLSQSTVSYHLQILHRAGLVKRVRDARTVLYQSL
ncbi:MAG: winged helix-turn-helix transcriptional regulator [Catenulisporales bacterium]|nr:winged helix-turn-helix transcriptional regulator [Catenulisporales bacterium]